MNADMKELGEAVLVAIAILGGLYLVLWIAYPWL